MSQALSRPGGLSGPTSRSLSRYRAAMIFAWTWRILALIGGIALTAWVCREGLARFGPGAAWMLVQVPLAMCTGFLAWRFAVRHERQWVRPARQLSRLIREVREGQTPIESLGEVHGPVAPLARLVQDVLHDLRREQQSKSRLQAEMSQRVRNRTDTLERKMASWQTQAYRDALTGLYNRRLLDEQLPKLLEQGHGCEYSMCVLSLDLDNFKPVNDKLGHAAGDRILRDVGQIIRSTVRERDLAFRVGGDEFLILMPECDIRAGAHLSRRIGTLVDQLTGTVRSEPKPGVSVGVICLADQRNLTAAAVLKQADTAMYQTKTARKAGR